MFLMYYGIVKSQKPLSSEEIDEKAIEFTIKAVEDEL